MPTPSPSREDSPALGFSQAAAAALVVGGLRGAKAAAKRVPEQVSMRRAAAIAMDIFACPEAAAAARDLTLVGAFSKVAAARAVEIDRRIRGAAQEDPTPLHRLTAAAVRGSCEAGAFLCSLLSSGGQSLLDGLHLRCGNAATQRFFETLFRNKDPLLSWLLCDADYTTRAAIASVMYHSRDAVGECPPSLVEVVRTGSQEARAALASLACSSESREMPDALAAMVSENDAKHEFESALKTLCLQNSLQQSCEEAHVVLKAIVQNAGETALQILAKHVEDGNEIVWWQLARVAMDPRARMKLQEMPPQTYRKLHVSSRAIELLYSGGADHPAPDGAAPDSVRHDKRRDRASVAAADAGPLVVGPASPPAHMRTRLRVRPIENHKLRMDAAHAERAAAIPALCRSTDFSQMLSTDPSEWRGFSDAGTGNDSWALSLSMAALCASTPMPVARVKRPLPRGAGKHLSRMKAAVMSRELIARRRREREQIDREQRADDSRNNAAAFRWAVAAVAKKAGDSVARAQIQRREQRARQIAQEADAWVEQYEQSLAAQRERERQEKVPLINRGRSRLLGRLVGGQRWFTESTPTPSPAPSPVAQPAKSTWFHAMPTRLSSMRQRNVMAQKVEEPPPQVCKWFSGATQPPKESVKVKWFTTAQASPPPPPEPRRRASSIVTSEAGVLTSAVIQDVDASDDGTPTSRGSGESSVPARPSVVKGAEKYVQRLRQAKQRTNLKGCTDVTGAFLEITERPRCRTAPGSRGPLAEHELDRIKQRLAQPRPRADPDRVERGYVVGDELSARFYPREGRKKLPARALAEHIARVSATRQQPKQKYEWESKMLLDDAQAADVGRRMSPSRQEQEERRRRDSIRRAEVRKKFEPPQKRLTSEGQSDLGHRLMVPLSQTDAAQRGDMHFVDHVLYDTQTGEVVTLARSGVGRMMARKRLPSMFADLHSLPLAPGDTGKRRPKQQSAAQLVGATRVQWNNLDVIGPLERDYSPWTYQGMGPPAPACVHPPFYWGACSVRVKMQDTSLVAKPLSAANNCRDAVTAAMQFAASVRQSGQRLDNVMLSAAWTQHEGQYFLLQPAAECSLYAWLGQQRSQGGVPLRSMLEVARQLAAALASLHAAGAVHRNVALRSCLVTDSAASPPTVALGDAPGPLAFDTGWHSGAPQRVAGHALSPALWWPPEVVEELRNEQRSDAALLASADFFGEPQDMYGFGVLLWELLSLGKWLPFTPAEKPLILQSRLSRIGSRVSELPQPPGCPDDLWMQCVVPCLQPNPKLRPRAGHVADCIARALSKATAAAGGAPLTEPGHGPSF
eukprot:TRINITY_DN14020_c0_g1_i2.p1 TRINITY_DN14020_c0_g1~~TRINITY_DN14020_c0_g1_i2.p1  ORF type:complete len:1451 (+),score=526.52 TRINITY_DN14020_c0_g1_i2:417-4355(+)